MEGFGSRAWGLVGFGIRVRCLWIAVRGSGSGDSGFVVRGSGFVVRGSWFGVRGSGFGVRRPDYTTVLRGGQARTRRPRGQSMKQQSSDLTHKVGARRCGRCRRGGPAGHRRGRRGRPVGFGVWGLGFGI